MRAREVTLPLVPCFIGCTSQGDSGELTLEVRMGESWWVDLTQAHNQGYE